MVEFRYTPSAPGQILQSITVTVISAFQSKRTVICNFRMELATDILISLLSLHCPTAKHIPHIFGVLPATFDMILVHENQCSPVAQRWSNSDIPPPPPGQILQSITVTVISALQSNRAVICPCEIAASALLLQGEGEEEEEEEEALI